MIIQVNSLTKKFNRLTALEKIQTTFSSGQCIALIGPNGCGKTTLIKSILGMVIPTEGHITINDQNISKDHTYRSKIGYMPQIGKYPSNMTIKDVVDTIKKIRKTKIEPDLDLYHNFKIASFEHKKMNTLSGGTIQKVSACLAFMNNPDILILDEPTAGLDLIAMEILKQKIAKEKEKGKLILITSHQLNELEEILTHVCMMDEAHILFFNSIQEIKDMTGKNILSSAVYSLFQNSKTPC